MRHITLRRMLLVEGTVFVLLIVASFLFVVLSPPPICGTEEPCARTGGMLFLLALLLFGPAAGVAFVVAGTRGKLSGLSITLLVIVHVFVIWLGAAMLRLTIRL